jgi:ribosomal protein S18 acetylase RimI-like enzyme
VDDATLAGLEHESMIEWLRVTAGQVPGSVIRSGGGVTAIATGQPMPLFNQVVVEAPSGTADGMRAAVAAMREVGAPFYIVLRRGPDDPLAPVLDELGVRLEDGALPGMAVHPIPVGEPAPEALPGHEIRRVADAAGLADHVRAASDGFEMPAPLVAAVVGEELWLRPGCAVYVGYTDGQPVSTGFSIRTGRTLGIFTIATVPAARRRGYGAAMTARLLADGAAAGCDVAALQASDQGRSVYERLGFRTVIEYDVWFGAPRRRSG